MGRSPRCPQKDTNVSGINSTPSRPSAQGFPLFQIAQVRHYAAEVRAGAYGQTPTDHVLEVTGRAPEGMETIVRRYIDDPTRVMPGLESGNFLSAMGLGWRALLTPAVDLDAWERSRDYPRITAGELAHENPDWVAATNRGSLLLLPDELGRPDLRGSVAATG